MLVAYSSRVTVCPCQLKEFQAGGVNVQTAGTTATVLNTTRREVPGLLLVRAVFGRPQHDVCGCRALQPARAPV